MAKSSVDRIETVLIPAGQFMMGDEDGRPDEQPVHRVTLSDFRIALLPVTNHDYGEFLSATDHESPRFWDAPKFNRQTQPVVGISWASAVEYCQWLSSVRGEQFRLPTEAEWEKAARGGLEHQRYPWGDEPWGDNGGRFSQDAPWDVGRCQPNGYSILDIGFNVHEWCYDWYDPKYYANSPEHDPQGPRTGERRASRGGAWRHLMKVSRCAARSSIPPDYRYNDYGFRVVLEV